jgi:Domain of unknown function (DUF3303)
MDYVATMKFRDSVSPGDRDAGLARRAVWKYPDGIKVIAEYWPMAGDVQVVSIFSAETVESVMELYFQWNDLFDISVNLAVSAEEGLRVGPDLFARLPRLQT